MPRKLFVLALFLTLAFPSVAPAQTFSPEQEAQIQSIIQQITDLQIQLLLARIEELKAQIALLLAQQSVVEQKVDTVITNTMPVTPVPPVAPPIPVPTIIVGKPYCENDQVLLPVKITGKWKEALVRVYSEPIGGLDIKMAFFPKSSPFAFANVFDLKAETSGYKNPSDSPFLNGSTFKYQVSVYDQSISNARGHLDLPSKKFILESSNGTLIEEIGDIILPVCE